MYYFFYSWIIFKCPDDISILIGCMRDWWKNILSFLFLRYQINKYKVRKLSTYLDYRLHIINVTLFTIWVNLFIYSLTNYMAIPKGGMYSTSTNVVMDFACNLFLNCIRFLFSNSEREWTIKKCSRNCIELWNVLQLFFKVENMVYWKHWFSISLEQTPISIFLHALLFSYCYEPKPFLISRKNIAA